MHTDTIWCVLQNASAFNGMNVRNFHFDDGPKSHWFVVLRNPCWMHSSASMRSPLNHMQKKIISFCFIDFDLRVRTLLKEKNRQSAYQMRACSRKTIPHLQTMMNKTTVLFPNEIKNRSQTQTCFLSVFSFTERNDENESEMSPQHSLYLKTAVNKIIHFYSISKKGKVNLAFCFLPLLLYWAFWFIFLFSRYLFGVLTVIELSTGLTQRCEKVGVQWHCDYHRIIVVRAMAAFMRQVAYSFMLSSPYFHSL